MSQILLIDTTGEKAQVSLSNDAIILQSVYNDNKKDHAAFLQPAIRQLILNCSIALNDIDAIAITAGPGSYTGLRVAMASAKGLCYALQKPLITLNTLEVLAASAIHLIKKTPVVKTNLFCPMIDARRMEVFTAIYDQQLQPVLHPKALILDLNSFEEQLNFPILFFGNGSEKWNNICKNRNALFETVSLIPEIMAQLAYRDLSQNHYSSLSNCEPFYLKSFQSSYN